MHPDHVGDRLVSVYDLLEERIEYRGVRDQSRWRTRTVGRVCKTCAQRDLDRPVEQGALL
jgi:hypothetical protein